MVNKKFVIFFFLQLIYDNSYSDLNLHLIFPFYEINKVSIVMKEEKFIELFFCHVIIIIVLIRIVLVSILCIIG